MTGRVDPSCKATAGSDVRLGIDCSKVHLFTLIKFIYIYVCFGNLLLLLLE